MKHHNIDIFASAHAAGDWYAVYQLYSGEFQQKPGETRFIDLMDSCIGGNERARKIVYDWALKIILRNMTERNDTVSSATYVDNLMKLSSYLCAQEADNPIYQYGLLNACFYDRKYEQVHKIANIMYSLDLERWLFSDVLSVDFCAYSIERKSHEIIMLADKYLSKADSYNRLFLLKILADARLDLAKQNKISCKL